MKQISLLLLFFVLLNPCNAKTLTVMSYNIHTGKGVDGKLDLDRIASVILKEEPDIVGLNEIEKNVSRSQCVNQVEYIAKKTNMYCVFGSNLIGDDGCKEKGEFGNAILSKYKIINSKNHTLYRQDKEEIRGCLEVEIEINKQKYVFLSTHLDCHRPEDIRNKQAYDILNIIKEKELPVILTGDMNAYIRTDGNDIENAAKILTENLFDAAESKPEQKIINTLVKGKNRIDFIFVNEKLKNSVLMYKVINYNDAKIASDHYPVLAKIKIND
ncbi:MAG: endonuclease/exonuclease/phosphatase family protein [Phycisphaerales bacterium]